MPAHNLTLDFSKAGTTIVYQAILDFFTTFNFRVIPGPRVSSRLFSSLQTMLVLLEKWMVSEAVM